MIVEFDKSFEKSLHKVNDLGTLKKLKRIIYQIETAQSLTSIPHIVKLTGYSAYYRLRLGDYRIGIELTNKSTIRLIVIAHRKDIYEVFP
jgi:mRNA interferase RelE/StbE